LSCLFIVVEKLVYILCGETEHLVEFLLGGDVPTDVEATRTSSKVTGLTPEMKILSKVPLNFLKMSR